MAPNCINKVDKRIKEKIKEHSSLSGQFHAIKHTFGSSVGKYLMLM